MVFQPHTVRGMLAEFVEYIIFMSGREMGTGVAFPRMHQVIIINLGAPFGVSDVYRGKPVGQPSEAKVGNEKERGTTLRRSSPDGIWINGKQDEPFLLENHGMTSMYAIGLKLGMVPYFAGLPAMETNNLAVGAQDWGAGSRLRSSAIATLRERLLGSSVEAGFGFIEWYLLSLVRGDDLSALRKVQWLGRAMYSKPVEEMCRTLGEIATRPERALTAVHDYFDQSHFIRDFKARTGITPSQYRRLCRQFPLIAQTPNFLSMSRETFLQFITDEDE
jgi:hypothetical protein